MGLKPITMTEPSPKESRMSNELEVTIMNNDAGRRSVLRAFVLTGVVTGAALAVSVTAFATTRDLHAVDHRAAAVATASSTTQDPGRTSAPSVSPSASSSVQGADESGKKSCNCPDLNPRSAVRTYVIQPGDTLCDISRREGVSIDKLVELNRITDPNLIWEGSALEVPEK